MQPPNSAPIKTRNYQYALSNQKSIQPNQYRNRFNAFNRQVEENDPTKIDMSFVDRSKSAADADIATKKKSGAETVDKMGPDISTFLPTFQQSVGGNAEARTATANNLKAFLPEYKPAEIDTAMEDEAMNLLGQQNRAGYLTALMEGRGGGMSGANRLDAAILDRSGAGRQLFEQGRQKLSGYTDVGNAAEAALGAQYEGKKQALSEEQKKLTNAINTEIAKLAEVSRLKAEEAGKKQIDPQELAAIIAEARAMRPDLPIHGLENYDKFLDRNVSMEETLGGKDAENFNYFQELIGGKPLAFRQQDPFMNRPEILKALIQKGQGESDRLKQAISGKAQAHENLQIRQENNQAAKDKIGNVIKVLEMQKEDLTTLPSYRGSKRAYDKNTANRNKDKVSKIDKQIAEYRKQIAEIDRPKGVK